MHGRQLPKTFGLGTGFVSNWDYYSLSLSTDLLLDIVLIHVILLVDNDVRLTMIRVFEGFERILEGLPRVATDSPDCPDWERRIEPEALALWVALAKAAAVSFDEATDRLPAYFRFTDGSQVEFRNGNQKHYRARANATFGMGGYGH